MTKLRFVFVVCAFVGAGLLTATSSRAQDGAFVERTATATATVVSVDTTSREVTLFTKDGREVTIVAGPEVRNLAEIDAGDTLTIAYYGGIVASLTAGDAEPLGAEADLTAARAAAGEKPGGAIASEFADTVTFDSYDAAAGSVRFTPSDGVQRTVTVQDEKMRAFVQSLKAGDKVDVVMVEVLGIVVGDPQ
ncbi:MAG: hypothetical protein R3C69_04435 [Geminicoccaceae bacterium]